MTLSGIVADYAHCGHVVVPGALDGATVEAARGHLGWLRDRRPAVGRRPAAGRGPTAGQGPADVGRPVTDGPILAVPLGTDRFVDGLVAGGTLPDLATRLLGSSAVCFGFTYIVKPARSALPALWHQDGHPWQEAGIPEAVTLWVALDEVDAGNGALVVVRGSHRTPARPLLAGDGPAFGGGPAEGGVGGGGPGGGLFGGGIDPGPLDPADVAVVAMVPGDVSAHHPNLIHGSGPNRSDKERRAMVVRYRPA